MYKATKTNTISNSKGKGKATTKNEEKAPCACCLEPHTTAFETFLEQHTRPILDVIVLKQVCIIDSRKGFDPPLQWSIHSALGLYSSARRYDHGEDDFKDRILMVLGKPVNGVCFKTVNPDEMSVIVQKSPMLISWRVILIDMHTLLENLNLAMVLSCVKVALSKRKDLKLVLIVRESERDEYQNIFVHAACISPWKQFVEAITPV